MLNIFLSHAFEVEYFPD